MTSAPEQHLGPFVGHFGSYTITPQDLQGVQLYRLGLGLAALALAIATGLSFVPSPGHLVAIDLCYALGWLALGLSLATIHIYMVSLHRLLQGFWLVGGVASLVLAYIGPGPLAQTVVDHPQAIWGVGFSFAALTGIYLKEAFCFDHFTSKLLTPLVPLLLLGHLFGPLSPPVEQGLLTLWAGLFLLFVGGKLGQPLVPDIGDKSVFDARHSPSNDQP